MDRAAARAEALRGARAGARPAARKPQGQSAHARASSSAAIRKPRSPPPPTRSTGAIETSYVEHAYIEPEAGWAEMDGDTLVIRACTQAPYMDRDDTAPVLGLPPDKVRIVPTATGGGFGSKLDLSCSR
jgi:xanthine dehydrogenase molybdopterin-binding subunit B